VSSLAIKNAFIFLFRPAFFLRLFRVKKITFTEYNWININSQPWAICEKFHTALMVNAILLLINIHEIGNHLFISYLNISLNWNPFLPFWNEDKFEQRCSAAILKIEMKNLEFLCSLFWGNLLVLESYSPIFGGINCRGCRKSAAPPADKAIMRVRPWLGLSQLFTIW